MRTRSFLSRHLTLSLVVGSLALGCGDSKKESNDDNIPTLPGDGDGDVTPGDGDGPGDGDVTPGDGDVTPGDGDVTPGDGDGDVTPGDGDVTPGDGDGDGDGDDCVAEPTTSVEILNSCPPAGVERREFDNEARLPESYEEGKPLPPLN